MSLKEDAFSRDANQDKSVDSEEEEVGNSYAVFECPGLAEVTSENVLKSFLYI